MKLKDVVPPGRSLDEYHRMFALTEADIEKSILGVTDGPASFNAEMHSLGKQAVSVDPLYAFRGEDIQKQFNSVIDNIIAQVYATPDNWVWGYHHSPRQLRAHRIQVMNTFVSDYAAGKLEGRYLVDKLPHLDFTDNQFDLALCSHFLFLYSEQYSYGFHHAAVLEMLRVAREVRIFPLLTLMLEKSPHLLPLVQDLEAQGYSVTIQKVDYELQKGGDELLKVHRAA
jgi:hypothetical protein